MNQDDKRHTVLIVDDTSENIDVLNCILSESYKIKVALNGEKALKITQKSPPSLILLDIMMPDMDGYEVCRQLKADPRTKHIPVIFVTAMSEIEDETKGFALGAVDYITKPVSPPIVEARVKTQIELQSARQQAENLLSKTLMGSVKLMTDILALVNPQAFSQAPRLKRYAHDIAVKLKLPDLWRFEMAALLSQIGCVTLPLEILEKVATDDKLSVREKELYTSHPTVGEELLKNIPRLGLIAQIIGRQQETITLHQLKGPIEEWDRAMLGGQILKVIIDYDRLITMGESSRSALVEMKNRGGIYVSEILNALDDTQGDSTEIMEKSVFIEDFKEGMVLLEDVTTASGTKLIEKGSEVTDNVLRLMSRYSKHRKIKEPVRVQMRDK